MIATFAFLAFVFIYFPIQLIIKCADSAKHDNMPNNKNNVGHIESEFLWYREHNKK